MKIDAINPANELQIPEQKKSSVTASGFEDLIKNFVADVNGDLLEAKKAEELLQSGKVENLIDVMTKIEKADISLRFATELRNKAIEAYQEIMRMQV